MDKRQLIKRIQGMSVEEAASYFMNNFPVTQICEALADVLLTDYQPIKPITISEEEFREHFFKKWSQIQLFFLLINNLLNICFPFR